MINKVTLVGRLGAEPEVRTLENGAMVAKFGLATSENYRDKAGEWQEQTEWHDVVVWRALAANGFPHRRKWKLHVKRGARTCDGGYNSQKPDGCRSGHKSSRASRYRNWR